MARRGKHTGKVYKFEKKRAGDLIKNKKTIIFFREKKKIGKKFCLVVIRGKFKSQSKKFAYFSLNMILKLYY